ncbi:uncharacterized protein SPPG_00795 [Spizellomyces punctatus DAOM BR117]|uniref:Ribonuclease P protein subunit p29 n=1 Tax=Spizellomyces punctatus (strain DAOM BR117) TaxID=645134 RepID=A0A0L0HW53_SPIPD|nr:uncharacterized protein SPPG_00795 [Spizellomyces punctatus DAOM BR117]KND05125.1 hypothetical protein SPPG_00795 [Spizellomyces punctatus DAOM BR117]|eukprot:XP_016613164.1 hypothetical protein SPPG_00795 [Spizellomyces punctatus DAOM BR117]
MPPKRKAAPSSSSGTPVPRLQEKRQRKNEVAQNQHLSTNPDATGPMYEPLPIGLTSDPSVPTDVTHAAIPTPFTPNFVQSIVASNQNASLNYETKVKNKVLLVDNPPASDSIRQQRRSKKDEMKRKRKTKRMSAKERKETGVWDVPVEAQKYALYVPLHNLWQGYINDLFDKSSQPGIILPRMMKADYHGALLTVAKSKCPTYIGISGIVIKETENMFYIITKDDCMKIIPKRNNVFTFQVNTNLFTLYGNQFRTRAGERAAKKFKEKPTVDL